ncbi:MAG TPA: hypothetical protein PLU81_05950 [Deltaproteobacteria bacterium]|nr:hypothetical protein [Deltaproteobacteria bacterium]
MNVKRAFVFVLIGIIAMMIGCSGSKYSDLVDVNVKFVSAMEDYIAATGKATAAKDMAKAINDYADKVEELAPKIKETRGKYPELMSGGEVPEELKAVEKKAQGLSQQVAASYMNMMKYMMDPGVQKAQERLNKAMMSMQ